MHIGAALVLIGTILVTLDIVLTIAKAPHAWLLQLGAFLIGLGVLLGHTQVFHLTAD